MELLRDSIPMVSLAVLVAAVCARAASSCLRPGLPRLASLLPVAAFLAAAPLAFSSAIIRGSAGFFFGWLGVFKVLLLAVGRGPLDPALPVLPFVFTTALPVKLRCCGATAACRANKSVSLVSCAVKVVIIAAILHAYQYVNQLHLYIRLALYGVHIYCFLDLVLPCIAAAGAALGMEMEPQFDRPYLASSLRDLWGRRWNLMVSAILRPSVYDPVRARAGKAPAIVATFLVSGLMHEVMVYYLTLRPPTGEMTAFFLLHGVCCVAEEWCARRWTERGWPKVRLPQGGRIPSLIHRSFCLEIRGYRFVNLSILFISLEVSNRIAGDGASLSLRPQIPLRLAPPSSTPAGPSLSLSSAAASFWLGFRPAASAPGVGSPAGRTSLSFPGLEVGHHRLGRQRRR